MLLPTKYSDISRTPILVGAYLISLSRKDNDVNLLFRRAMRFSPGPRPPLDFNEVVAGFIFLFACGLITLEGTRVVIHAPR